jgi:basic membrane protein A and related proteins
MVVFVAACQAPASTSPTTTAATGAAQTASQAPALKVAWIFEGVINDASFTQHQFESMKYLESKLPVQNTYAEKVTPADSPRAMRDYVNGGYKIIYAASGTYVAAAVQTAKDFPGSTFVVYGGAPIPDVTPNVWNVANKQGYAEGFYLAGVLAGLTTKTNKIGFVGGLKLPVYQAALDGYTLGAKSVNPGIDVKGVFTGDFDDAAKAKEAATAQIEGGADILAHSLNLGFVGLVEATKAKPGVSLIGNDLDQDRTAPGLVLTSVILDYGRIAVQVVGEVQKGKLGGFFASNLATETIYLLPIRSDVPASATAKVEQTRSDIVSGKLKVTVP